MHGNTGSGNNNNRPKYKPVGLLYGKDHLIIKVSFHPTGAYRLPGIQMQQTINSGLNAAAFLGSEVTKVLHQLQQTSSYDCMIELVLRFYKKN